MTCKHIDKLTKRWEKYHQDIRKNITNAEDGHTKACFISQAVTLKICIDEIHELSGVSNENCNSV